MSLIIGFDRLMARLRRPDFIERPTSVLLDSWADDLRADAAAHAPVWKGALKNAILAERDHAALPLWAKVFADVPEARWVEYGTGLLSDDPASAHRRYFPPPLALQPWAEDHGLNPYAVAAGIYQRGGIAPKHFLRDAAARAVARMPKYEGQFAANVERQAAAGG